MISNASHTNVNWRHNFFRLLLFVQQQGFVSDWLSQNEPEQTRHSDACSTTAGIWYLIGFFLMILVLQNLIQLNALFDFGLRLEYQD